MTITKKEIASIRIKACKLVDSPAKQAIEEQVEEEEIQEQPAEEKKPAAVNVPEPKTPKKASGDDMPGLFDDVD